MVVVCRQVVILAAVIFFIIIALPTTKTDHEPPPPVGPFAVLEKDATKSVDGRSGRKFIDDYDMGDNVGASLRPPPFFRSLPVYPKIPPPHLSLHPPFPCTPPHKIGILSSFVTMIFLMLVFHSSVSILHPFPASSLVGVGQVQWPLDPLRRT